MKVTDVIDHYSEQPIFRPDGKSKMKYDFDFRKIGDIVWRYMNSSNDIEAFNNQIKVGFVSGGGEYRIVNSFNGEIIKKG